MMPTFTAGPDNRVIPFQGVLNFRDMGGYETTDGRTVKYGIFYRSAELSGMTADDLELFHTLGIRTIFDYRDEAEAARQPDPVYEHITNIRIAAMDQTNVPADIRELVKSDFFKHMTPEAFGKMYVDMAFDSPAYKQLMELIQQPESLGLLHHCAAGRDRTGVGGAFILLALGVPRETIIADYLISNQTLTPMNDKMKAQLAEVLTLEQLTAASAMFELRREFIEAVFHAIDSKYGDTEAFLEQEFGLTSVKRELLQAHCLE